MAKPTRQKSIRQLRQKRRWSQLDVARGVGASPSSVCLWERGLRMPRPRMQRRLADLFGVSVEAIAFGPADQPLQERP
jgi:transcriptional regulator with XRE-family HTH domain